MATLHGTLSGLATKKLMERAFSIFGEARYQRLAAISVAHLYNLRQRTGYLRVRQVFTKTRPVNLPIGERRAPAPNNRPGSPRAWTACIKAIRMASKASITSTPWTASPSTKGSRAASASARPSSSPCSRNCCKASPSPSSDFTATTARSSSITKSRNCSTSCSSKSKPNHAPDTATITLRLNPKIMQSCANTWAIATSRNASQPWSMPSAGSTSTLTSTSTGRACSPKPSPTSVAEAASATPTN